MRTIKLVKLLRLSLLVAMLSIGLNVTAQQIVDIERVDTYKLYSNMVANVYVYENSDDTYTVRVKDYQYQYLTEFFSLDIETKDDFLALFIKFNSLSKGGKFLFGETIIMKDYVNGMSIRVGSKYSRIGKGVLKKIYNKLKQ